MTNLPSLACPACSATLTKENDGWRCSSCNARYVETRGIPVLFDSTHLKLFRESEGTVQEYYRNVPKIYGTRHHVAMPGAAQFKKEFTEKLRPYVSPRLHVLETGAGTGFGTGILRELFPDLMIADSSVEMLEIARAENPDIACIACSTENLPFPPGTFDLVVGNNTFYLIEDKQRAAYSLAKAVKPGGRVIFSEMNPFHPLWPTMFTIKGRWFERSIWQCFPWQMRTYFAKAGMDVEEVDFYSFSPYFAGAGLLKVLAVIKALFGWSKLFRRFTAIRVFYVLRKRA